MTRTKKIGALAIALAALLILPAQGLAAGPEWRLWSISDTATAAPDPSFEYQVEARNIGDAPTDGSEIQLLVELPAGMVAKSATYFDGSITNFLFTCRDAADGVSPVAGATAVRCKSTSTLQPRQIMKLILIAEVKAGAPAPLLAHLSVNGGAAPSASTVDPTELSDTPTPFGIETFDAAFLDSAAQPATLAGAHPAANVTTFSLNTLTDPSPVRAAIWPVEPLRDAYVDLAPGVIGNPGVMGRCTLLQLSNGRDLLNIRPLCPSDSQLGKATLLFKGVSAGSNEATVPLYNLDPPPGVAASFGFTFLGSVVVLDARVRTDDHYGVTVGATMAPEALAVIGNTVEIWGDPADESHDLERSCPDGGNPFAGDATAPADCPEAYTRPADQAFLRNPTSCTPAGQGMRTDVRVDSWTNPGVFDEATAVTHEAPGIPYPPDAWGPTVGIEGCEVVPFSPSLSGAPPAGAQAGQPTAFSFDLSMPQQGLEESEATSESDLRKAVVTLPEGVRLNPSAADGLGSCSPAQIGLTTPVGQADAHFTAEPASCPDNAKIGSLTIQTPLLDHQVNGDVYLAQQSQNPFGTLNALYLVADDEASGLVLKLPGRVDLDPATGQVTTTFDDNPQLPFTNLHLELHSGPRAPLAAPDMCGTYTTHAVLTGWSGKTVASDSTFAIENGCGGGFAPKLEAGTENPIAGQTSPFSLRLTRQDSDQEFAGLKLSMPPGLSGYLAGIPYCPDATLAAISAEPGTGAGQEASPSCPAASRVGTATVGAGAGPTPFFTRAGRVYLAGPYKGAPLSLAVVNPAVAGPFDLGSVVVRNAVHVDPTSAQLSVDSDPLPTILHGIPLDLRDIRVDVDRSRFILNPTSCEPMQVGSAISSVQGAVANPSDHFQVTGCDALGFKPALTLRLSGGTKRSKNPAVTAVLRPRAGNANTERISVALPHSEFLDQSHIRTICTRVQFAADTCPAGSVYGRVVAKTPILEQPLTGNVYLRSSDNPLPDMVLKLQGPPSLPIEVYAVGRIDSVNGGIRTTFEGLPDAPLSEVVMSLPGGKKSLIENSTDICRRKKKATVQMDGHNGAIRDFRPVLKVKCPKRKGGKRHGGHRPKQ